MNKKILSIGILTSIFGSSSYASLIAHYTFDIDGSATVGTDAALGDAASIDTANAKVGAGALSLSGAPTVDGSGNDGAVSGNSFNWTASDERTVAFWMRATANDKGDANATMLSLGTGGGSGIRFDVRLTGNNLRLEVQGAGTNTTEAIADGTWRHIAIVVPNATSTLGNVQYYIDGSLGGTFSGAQNINTGTAPLRIGDSFQDTARDFKGLIDDVKIFDSALNASEVMALTVVPEPSSTALLGLGALSLVLRRRR